MAEQKLTQLMAAIPELGHVPQCSLPAYGAIAAAGCGSNLACICSNSNFFLTLEGVILQGTCTPADVQGSLGSARTICIKAAPWLNHSRGPEVVTAITILTVIATIAVVLRCIARRITKLSFGWDDWLILVALVWSYGQTITQYLAVHNGFGRHILLLDEQQIINFSKAFLATTLIFPVSGAATKLSILFFYCRIFTTPRFRHISIIIGVVVVLWFISFIFLQFFTCIPLAYNWDKSIPGGHCINSNYVAYFGTSPPDIITNIAILILPIPYLWGLQMQRIRKIAITGIFILASFATVGSIVKIPFIAELKPTDVSYSVVDAGIWLSVELNIGILSACLPILRPLFSKTFPSTIRSKLSLSRTARYGTGSQRLHDLEKPPKSDPRSSTLANSRISGGVYSGPASGNGKGHKAWYNNAVSAMASKDEDTVSDGSQEEMVPMGQIAVRHELDWDARDNERGVTPPAA